MTDSAPPAELPEALSVARVVATPVARLRAAPLVEDRPPTTILRGWWDRALDRVPLVRRAKRASTGYAASALVHAVALVAAGLVTWAVDRPPGRGELLATFLDPNPPPLDDRLLEVPRDRQHELSESSGIAVAVATPGSESLAEVRRQAEAERRARSSPFATLSTEGLLARAPAGPEQALAGRAPGAKARLLVDGGGSEASERAVVRGLKWLQAHQLDDGGWSFQHQQGACRGYCRHPGTEPSRTAATALALLPFLGAGHTHQSGDFRETVDRGLRWLRSRMQATPHGGDLMDGSMYGQGLATIAICESFAMTRDPELYPYARSAVEFIVYAQDRGGGGWRYQPGTPGDMTVSGWQLMALRSAQMAKIPVPEETLSRAGRFLDSLAMDGGAAYGYMSPERGATTTSIGLLMRMYGGWRREEPPLRRGVEFLSRTGPADKNLYFNYYATQVLHHVGGPEWAAWNRKLRDYLVQTQSETGHEAGSWYFQEKHGDAGGRLYNTAVAVMILEVYYRYLPLYGSRAVDEF